MSKKLEGKIALTTGGSRGIGAGIAERLAADRASALLGTLHAFVYGWAIADALQLARCRHGELGIEMLRMQVGIHSLDDPR